MKSVTFKIHGMHCNSCAETLKELLEREPGVKTASVVFEKAEARVVYDPAAIDEKRLAAAAQRPGYRVIGRTL